MPRYLGRDAIAVAAGLVGPLIVSVALTPFRGGMSNTNVALILVVVVVAVAANGHRAAGAIAALSAAVWFDFLFTEPYQRFTITTRADVETTVLLLVVGVAVAQLAARARRLHVVAITDAGYLAQIHDTAELARSGASARVVVDRVKVELTELLQLRECRFEYGSLLGHPPRLERDGAVVWDRRHWDVDRSGLPDEEVELRTFHNGHYYGRFMLRAPRGLPRHPCRPGWWRSRWPIRSVPRSGARRTRTAVESCGCSGLEAVAHAGFGEQVPGPGRVGLEFAA